MEKKFITPGRTIGRSNVDCSKNIFPGTKGLSNHYFQGIFFFSRTNGLYFFEVQKAYQMPIFKEFFPKARAYFFRSTKGLSNHDIQGLFSKNKESIFPKDKRSIKRGFSRNQT